MQRLRKSAATITTTLMAIFLCASQAAIVCGQRAERRVATGSLPPPKFADPNAHADSPRRSLRSRSSSTVGLPHDMCPAQCLASSLTVNWFG